VFTEPNGLCGGEEHAKGRGITRYYQIFLKILEPSSSARFSQLHDSTGRRTSLQLDRGEACQGELHVVRVST
jgi:hypothetical protein